MVITVNGVDWQEPSLELRSLFDDSPSQLVPLDIIRQFHYPSPNETSHILSLIAIEEHHVSTLQEQLQPLRSRLEPLISAKPHRIKRLRPNEPSELDKIQQEVDALETIKAPLEQRARELRHLTSAVRRVPFELWEEIFSLASTCNSNGCSTFNVGQPKCSCVWKFPALSLSQVCRSWRLFVSGMPRLWSQFAVDLDNFPIRLQPLLELYLRTARDQGRPLDIRLLAGSGAADSWPSPVPIMSPASKGAFEKILDILPQCRLLDIKLDHRFISAALSSPPATGWTTLPHLTTLALRLADPGPQIVNTTRWFWEAICTGSPNLKHVTTNELHIQQAGFTIFPYAQLTSLEVLRLAETC
ncbi:hypothetical protein PM082_006485 [Marasmius tenuissimus]|nr:hypothetical protein PM082_006485 [Marasmius tenuissimus]